MIEWLLDLHPRNVQRSLEIEKWLDKYYDSDIFEFRMYHKEWYEE